MNALQGVLFVCMAKQETKKAGGINPGPAYRYRLINRKGFSAREVSRQKQ